MKRTTLATTGAVTLAMGLFCTPVALADEATETDGLDTTSNVVNVNETVEDNGNADAGKQETQENENAGADMEASSADANENEAGDGAATSNANESASDTDSKPAMGTQSIASNTSAKQTAAKPGNCDKIIGLNSKILVILTPKKDTAIYSSTATSRKKLCVLKAGTSIIANTKGMVKGKNYKFIKVKHIVNGKEKAGYIAASRCSYTLLDKRNFGLSSTKGDNAKRIAACKYALKFLGTHYSTSSSNGIDCRKLVEKAYTSAKISTSKHRIHAGSASGLTSYGTKIKSSKLKAGDMVFYKGLDGCANHHVAMYIGHGLVIHATAHRGNAGKGFPRQDYPNNGVHISKLNYRGTPTAYRSIAKYL